MSAYGWIRDREAACLAWVQDGGVFTDSSKTKKIGTERDGNLYALDGKPLDMHLSDFDTRKPSAADSSAARLKKLATAA